MRRTVRTVVVLACALLPAAGIAAPTFDFTGNSFPGGTGGTYNQVSETAQDIAVSPDGMVVHGADWVESAHDVRVITQSGDSVGPRPGSSAGRFRENGAGPRAVAITDTSVYAAQWRARRVVKWDRSAFIGTGCAGCTMNGTTFTVAGSGTLVGLAVGGGRIFVADAGASVGEVVPDTATIKALSESTGALLNTWTVPRVRHLDVDRQGNVWALQQRTSTQAPRLSRYTPTGGALESFALTGDPTDVAADPNADEVLISDNGPDQDIERYSYTGTQTGHFGESYLNGPTPGLIGSLRFAGPRGVDESSNGDIYVLESVPGRGQHGWDETGDGAMFSRYHPNGTRVWMRYGIMGQPGEVNNDGSRFYAGNITYQRQADGHYTPYAVNVDPFTGNDPRLPNGTLTFGNSTTRTDYREFDGQKWIARHQANNDYLRVYRLDGEIARFVRGFPSKPGQAIADNGDVWQASGNQVTRYPYTGNSTWGAAVTYPAPAAFNDLRRIEVHGSSVYLSGYGSGAAFEAGFDGWKISGKRVARYDALPTGSGWIAPRWTVDVPWPAYPQKPTSMSTDGTTVAVAYLSGGDSRSQGYVRTYDAATGAAQLRLVPPAEYGEMYGWLDMMESIAFKNGVLSWEGIGQNKSILWGELASPPPPPPTDTDGDGVPDSTDQCPNDPGPASNNGCPLPPPPPPPPPTQEKLSAVTDAFSGTALAAQWVVRVGSPGVSNGRLVLPANGGWNNVRTGWTRDGRDTCVRVTAVTQGTNATLAVNYADMSHRFLFERTGGSVAVKVVNGTASTVATVSGSTTTLNKWRICTAGTTVTWSTQTATDSTWTTIATRTIPSTFDLLKAEIELGGKGTSQSQFDNLNL
jgi:hypothetical protein